ncbi:MAG TPA: TMEM175 family protein [Vicinamibacterales bacterium]|nr:TMEM175 family protein [Vicinamibacterales bacterium]
MIRTGREVSRVEGFSDAVFGFALTLLVVSLEVPESFDDLRAVLAGFVPFGLMFALMCWIWYEHYAFFRRFGAEDRISITLNCVLLFIVVFFVYPLKFVFSNVVKLIAGQPFAFREMSVADNRLLLSVYSAGFVGIMLVFVLLYWNVYRRRDALRLSDEDVFDAAAGARTHALSTCVGLVSLVLAWTLPVNWFWLAGPVYALQGPIHYRNGVLIARARARAFPSSTPAHQ